MSIFERQPTVFTAAEKMTHTAEGAAEGEYTRAKTSVWWDIENCPVPKGLDAHGIAQKINSALMNMNYCGPLSISAYGNTDLIPKSVQQALSSTGVSLNHVPSGRKDASDKKILVDMFLWMVENPAPANIMLISGDGDFSDALHRLRMRRYNILLAHPQDAPPSLLASAKTSWLWRSLVASGCPPTQCQFSRLVDHGSCSFDSEISSQDVSVSEHVLSTQLVDSGSGSGSSKAARKKLKGINVQKETNQLLQQETKGKNFRQKWFCKVCNVACKSIEIFTTHLLGKEHTAQLVVKWELEQNLDLLGEPENVAAVLSECHEQDVEITSKVVESGVEMSAHCCSPSVVKKQAETMGQALVDAKNIGESVQGNDLQSQDAQESSMKCLEKQNSERRETVTASERSGSEFWQDFKERLDRNGVAPLNVVDHVFSELSRDFRVPKEVRECFDAIFKKLEPTQNEIEIEKLEGMVKQGLEIESGELENALAGPTENLEEDMNKKKKKKRKKKKSTVIEDIDEPYVCSICSVICDSPDMFETHLKGRKHAAKIKKHAEALLDDQHIQEEIIQDNGHSKDMTVGLRVKPGEEPENIGYLDKQRQELRDRCATSERRVEEFFKTVEVLENDYKSLPNAECVFTELNPEFSAPKEAREWIDANSQKPELSQDANLTQEFESIPNQNSGDPESSSAGATEHPEEYMDPKKMVKVTKDKAEPEAYVCTICSVICVCPTVFESHLMGRRHAARVKKHAEVLFDDKNILEESLKEKDHPRDALEELQFEPRDAQVSIQVASRSTEEGEDNENEQIPSTEFQEPKEASRERLKRLEVSLEDTSQQTLVEAENASERVEEVMKTRKKNGATATLFTVCELCNVVGHTQMDVDSHMAGKRHAATLKKQGVYNLPKYVKKQTLVKAENVSERVEEVAETRKENGAAATLFRVCELCNVMGNTQKNFDSHLAGKRHAATLKRQVVVVNK